MSKSWGDRESLDNAEPRPEGRGYCQLCGFGPLPLWGYNPGDPVLCDRDLGGCGAHVRPVPYPVGESLGEALPAGAGSVRTWESCCKPYTPVGDQLVHSRWCEYYPGEALTPAERQGYRAENRSKLVHPAGSEIEQEWYRPWWKEQTYTEAHMDDDDDREGEDAESTRRR